MEEGGGSHRNELEMEGDCGTVGERLTTTQVKSLRINCVLAVMLHYAVNSLGKDLHS